MSLQSIWRTFRHYPEGVTMADQSMRLQPPAALMQVFGLSLLKVSGVLGASVVLLCHNERVA